MSGIYIWSVQIGEQGVCSDYINQTSCINAGCYWWSDGTCHNIQEGGGGDYLPIIIGGIAVVAVGALIAYFGKKSKES